MDEQDTVMIPYFAHEGEMSRMERANKRLWIVIIILIVCLVGSNVGWMIYESQFEDVVTETTVRQHVDTGDGMAVVSGTGDAIYGESNADDNGKDTQTGQSK